MFGDGFEQHTLSAPVSFPEGVKGVDFAKVESQTLAEQILRLTTQTIFTTQLRKDALALASNKLVSAKQAFALAHRHGAQLASPRVYIPEDALVNLLEVIQVKFSGDRRFAQLI